MTESVTPEEEQRATQQRGGRATCEHEFYWSAPAINEVGWFCITCRHKPGEPPGFDPQLDRELISEKCSAILGELVDTGWFCPMNSDVGLAMSAAAARACVDTGCFDQQTIVATLMGSPSGIHSSVSYAAYWKQISEGILSGHDERARCHCGELATAFKIGKGQSIGTCREHTRSPFLDLEERRTDGKKDKKNN